MRRWLHVRTCAKLFRHIWRPDGAVGLCLVFKHKQFDQLDNQQHDKHYINRASRMRWDMLMDLGSGQR